MAGDHAGVGGFLGVLGSCSRPPTARSTSTSSSASAPTGGRPSGSTPRWAATATTDPRVAQRLRVPVRGRSHRRDVDVPRRPRPTRPRRSSPDRAAAGWARLAAWCKPSRTLGRRATTAGGATRGGCWSTLASTASTSTISTGLATAAYLTGHDEEGFAHWVRAHQLCVGRGRGAPGGALRGEARPGPRVQGRPRPLPGLGRPHRPPAGGGGHRLRRAGLPRVRPGDAAALRGRRHRRGARPLRPGRQDRRPLRPPRARHARPHRRGPHADLPGRHRRGDGAARRGHGVDRSRRAVTARHRRRLLHGDRRLRGAVRPRPVPGVDRVVRALVRHPAGARALPWPLLPAPRRGARAARAGPKRSPRPATPAIASPPRSTRPRSARACAIEGDLLRLVGDLDGAEAAYQRASEYGHDPQPGLALLRLAQGRPTPPTP